MQAAMERAISAFAFELEAQFRVLGVFAANSGEIGRAHEELVRNTLRRFLPVTCRVCSGFITKQTGSSSQQDVIIYRELGVPVLYEIGDCKVIDAEAVLGCIEVKTDLSSTEVLRGAIQSLARANEMCGAATGIFAWEGLDLASTMEVLWSLLRTSPPADRPRLPAFIYVRNKYLLIANNTTGQLDEKPFVLFALGAGENANGKSLLAILSNLWLHGLQRVCDWPWWLYDPKLFLKEMTTSDPLLEWPDDLRRRNEQALKEIRAREAKS